MAIRRRWPDIPVGAADTFMIIAATVVPETVVMIHGDDVFVLHGVRERVEVIRQPCPCTARHPPGDSRFCFFYAIGSYRAIHQGS